jgi:hypothetical protein
MRANTFSFRLLIAAASLSLAGASQAAITVSPATSPTAFNAAVAGSIDSFSNLTINTNIGATSTSRSAGSLGYGISTQTDLYVVPVAGQVALSTGSFADTLNFTGFLTPVFAFGANLYGTNILGEATAGGVTVVVTDINNLSKTQTIAGGAASSFIGFTSDAAIATVVVSLTAPNTNTFVTTDNVVLSAALPAVPEASSWLMMLVGGAAVVGLRARRRA